MSIVNKSLRLIQKNIKKYNSISRVNRLNKVKGELQKRLSGKRCYVLGSAPEVDLSGYMEGDVVVSVNGSALNAKRLGLPEPRVTVVDFELLDPIVNQEKFSRSVIIKEEMLKGLDLGLLLSTQSNSSIGGDPNCLQARFEAHFQLYKEDCMKIVHNVTQTRNLEKTLQGLLSRGGMAIALCAYGGAKEIFFSGFSLFKDPKFDHPPYFHAADFYNQNSLDSISWQLESYNRYDLDTRNHSLADCILIGQLVLAGINIQTSSKDFAPLLSNWGKTSIDGI